MTKSSFFSVGVFLMLFNLFSCKKDESESISNSDFCGAIQDTVFTQTKTAVDGFLKTLPGELSEQQKLEQLRDWLKGKSCIAKVEIVCVSCIKTDPAQSELRIWFNVNGRQKAQIMDVSMSEPLRFVRYHD